MTAGPLRIARLRSAAGHRDPFAARHRLLREIGEADWTPRGLGAEALLVVRRLRAATGARSTPALRGVANVREALGDIASRAARPARGYVPDSAPAVVFADRAELLACLARDWRAGRLGAWWWRLVLGEVRGEGAVLDAWLARPGAIAPALAMLHESGDAVPFLRAVGAAGAAQLVEHLVTAHALTALRGIEREAADPPAAVRLADAERSAAAPRSAPATAPWAAFDGQHEIDALPATLALPLGIALVLQAAPAHARSLAFAEGVRHWLADADALETAEATLHARVHHVRRPHPEAPALDDAQRPRPGPAPVAPTAACDTDHTSSPLAPAATPSSGIEPPMLHPSARRPTAPDVSRLPVQTRYGGTFLLLNAALALGLYGDFTQPRTPGLALSPWDLLALVGPRLARRSLRRDPLDGLLAALAGRDARTPPGAGFTPPAGTLAQWADATAVMLGARIAQALGLRSRVRAGLMVTRLPARVGVGTERLDVTFALAALPIELRLAGLDRDPGWIPAAGRDVRFHFE